METKNLIRGKFAVLPMKILYPRSMDILQKILLLHGVFIRF